MSGSDDTPRGGERGPRERAVEGKRPEVAAAAAPPLLPLHPRGGATVVDLQAVIDNLRGIKGDLELYHRTRPPDGESTSERFQVSVWMRQVTDHMATLETIVMHKGATRLVMAPADADAVVGMPPVIDRWIREELPFREVRTIVSAILQGADEIALSAAAGAPTTAPPSLHPRDRQRP